MVAIAWSVVVMRAVHPLLPQKLVNLHAGMTAAQYAAAAPSPLDPLVNALITMAIGLVPTLGILISGALLYLVARIHGSATSLSDQSKAILAQVDAAAKAAAVAAVEAQRARDVAARANVPSNAEIVRQLAAASAALSAVVGAATAKIDENTRITRDVGAQAAAAYSAANHVNEKIADVTGALVGQSPEAQAAARETMEHIRSTTDATLDIVADDKAGKGTP